MSELVRLLETSEDELELQLLESARVEAPGPAGLRDTALALGLTAAAAKALADSLTASQALAHATSVHAATTASGLGGSSGVGAAAGGASLGTVAKFVAAGALLSFGTMTTIEHTRAPSAPTQAAAIPQKAKSPAKARASVPLALPSEPAVPTITPSALPEINRPKAASSRPKQTGSTESADSNAAVAPEPIAVPVATPAPTVSAAPSNASLAAEIRLLDRTRAALAAGDKAAARRLLHAYADSRPSAILTHEANLLRVKLLLAEGDRRAAAALARQIIAQHPESNHGDSLRSLAAER